MRYLRKFSPPLSKCKADNYAIITCLYKKEQFGTALFCFSIRYYFVFRFSIISAATFGGTSS